MASNTKVVQKLNDKPVATEVIAQAIVEISQGVKVLRAGKLNDKALLILLHKSSGVAQYEIKKVLASLQTLEKDYLK